MKRNVFQLAAIATATFIFVITGCSPKITAVISSTDKAVTTVECAIPDVLSDLTLSLTGSDMRSLISTGEIKQNLQANGISTVSCSISADNTFTLKTGDMSPVALPIPVETGRNSLTITISPKAIQDCIVLLPQETVETFDLLMAPVLTGETMTADEYVDLIGAVYGGSVAEELKESILTLELYTPEPATLSVIRSTESDVLSASKNRMVYEFSVVRLLTMQKPVILELFW